MKIRLSATELSPLMKEINQLLTQFKVDSPQVETELIISHFFKLTRSQIYLKPDLHVTWKVRLQIEKILRTRYHHCPLQYLLEEVEFYNSILFVDQNVLIPRPETELLVDMILQENQQKTLSICDIGTGSGAIAIALKKARADWHITATDVSSAALSIAKKNADYNKCQIDFLVSDIFEQIVSKFDLIVSNPPYISESDYLHMQAELFYEPSIALIAPEDGLYFYRKIIKSAPIYLNLPGTLYLEIGAEQNSEIAKIAKNYYADKVVTKQDYNNFDRYMVITFS